MAYQRTPSLAGAQLVSVASYGAIGDGTTDDRAAIQAAIQAVSTSGGGVVFLPPKVYALGSALNPRSNVTVYGPGATLKPTWAGYAIGSDSTAVTNFSLDSVTFLGTVNEFPAVPKRTRTTSGTGCTVAVYIDGSLDSTGSFPAWSNFTMRNCSVRNCTSLPIRIFGVSGKVIVTGNEFYNCMDAGFAFNEEVICTSNHSMLSADNGFSISRGNLKVTCTGNTVELAAYHGIWLSGFTGTVGPNAFSCNGNTIKDVGQNGIIVQDASMIGTVVGNTIDKNYRRGDSTAVTDAECSGIVLRGNSSTPGTPGTSLIYGVTVANNTIYRAPKAGILFNGCTAVNIDNNNIVDCGSQYLADGTTTITSSYTSTNVGILSDQPTTNIDVQVRHNSVTDNRVTPYLNWGLYPTTMAGMRALGNIMSGARNVSNLSTPIGGNEVGLLDAGQETMPRWAATSVSITMSSGAVRFAYFTARRTQSIGNLRLSTANTAAAATPSLVRFGLYSVAANGDLALLSQTSSDTAIFAATQTAYTRALGAPQAVYAGQRYVIAAIVVTAAAAPTVSGTVAAIAPSEAGLAPTLCKVLTAQTDLLSSYTAAGINDTQSMIYAVALP